MRFFRTRLTVLLALALWLGCAARADCGLREDMLDLVPDDVSLCLVVNQLSNNTKMISGTQWALKLEHSPVFKSLVNMKEVQDILKLDKTLMEVAQINLSSIRDFILGDCVVFGYQQAKEKQQSDHILFIVHAQRADLLKELVGKINRQQEANGDMKQLLEKKHKNVGYFERKMTMGSLGQFYVQNEALFVLSTSEAMLHQIIDRNFKDGKLIPADQSKPRSVVSKSIEKLGVDQAVATFWVNPRAYDDYWLQPAGNKNFLGQNFLKYWKAVDALAVSLIAGQEVDFLVSIQGRQDDLPKSAQKLLDSACETSELWQKFPRKAILTTAARMDFASGLDTVTSLLSNPASEKLMDTLKKKIAAAVHRDFLKDILPRLGPDVGLCVAPNPDPTGFPLTTAAMRFQSGPKDHGFDKAIFRALEVVVRFSVFDYNTKLKGSKDDIKVKSTHQDGLEELTLSGSLFPKGFQPTLALKSGYLLAASSPLAVKQFAASSEPVTGLPVLHLSMPELGKLMKDHKPFLIETFGEQNPAPAPAPGTNHWFDDLLAAINLAESVNISQKQVKGQVTWTVRVQMNNSMK